jgi:ATPase subunit of ABC transporter with duplicated ATPase domains
MLGCLKLRPDCLNRKLRELSAGERTKVALAKILTGDANILLLDEPTNHLEIEAQEALEEALKGYPGGLVVGTHDRAFLEALGPDLSILNLHALTEQ